MKPGLTLLAWGVLWLATAGLSADPAVGPGPETLRRGSALASVCAGRECAAGLLVLGSGGLLAAGAAPAVSKPRVLLQTAAGNIELELDADRARITTTNFLHYVAAGLYAAGRFHRTVTLSNQPNNPVRIQVIQAGANPARTNEFPAAIPLERTRDTGLRHVDGTVSMARDGPDSAQDEFFICIGDQPELDFGGRRNPDGQGFAAFGRVVRGMDVVRKIQASPAAGQTLTPPIRIQRALRID